MGASSFDSLYSCTKSRIRGHSKDSDFADLSQHSPFTFIDPQLLNVFAIGYGPSLAVSKLSWMRNGFRKRSDYPMRKRVLIWLVLLNFLNAIGGVQATDTFRSESRDTGRFTILKTFQGAAVLDQTTQLIWERAPHSIEVTWTTATTRCALRTVGGRTGWRLPSFIELMTLVEPLPANIAVAPALPPGHPFQGIKAGSYWTSNALSSESAQAYTVDLLRADVESQLKSQTYPLWCVRGGSSDRISDSPLPQPTGLI